MSLTIDDTDGIIAYYIFENDDYKDGLDQLKIIMISFGKSRYNKFIKTCIDSYYRQTFAIFRVTSIESLIRKIYTKKAVKYYPYPEIFANNCYNIDFKQLNAPHRLYLYYYSIYCGYVPIKMKASYHDIIGSNRYNDYWSKKRNPTGAWPDVYYHDRKLYHITDVHADKNDDCMLCDYLLHLDKNLYTYEPASYNELRKIKIFNPEYYICVQKGKTLKDSLFIPNRPVFPCHLMMTTSRQDIICIKIL